MRIPIALTIAAMTLLSAPFLVPAGIAYAEERFFDADQYHDGFRDHGEYPWVFAPRECDTDSGVRHYDLTEGGVGPTWAWVAPVLVADGADPDLLQDISNTGPVAIPCHLAPEWIDTDGDLIVDSQTGAVLSYMPGFMAGELFTTFFEPGADNDKDLRVDCDGAADLNGDGVVDHLYITHRAPGNTAGNGLFPVTASARRFILDGVAPTAVVGLPSLNANGWINTAAEVSLDPDDDCWLVEYAAIFVDGEPVRTEATEEEFSIAIDEPGSHEVTVEVVDYAHNKFSDGPFLVAVDSVPPGVAIESPMRLPAFNLGGVFLPGQTVTVEAMADDATSGADIVDFADSVQGLFSSTGAGAGNGMHSAQWTVPMASGFATLTVSVTDEAGNVAQDSIDVFILG